VAVEFEWDKEKAAGNLEKHGISFDGAKTVFSDPLARVVDDEWHAEDEAREIITGYSSKNRILVTIFIEREQDKVRIISARKAVPLERKKYEENAKRLRKANR
jgi:uncharacterized DUF497 family protein